MNYNDTLKKDIIKDLCTRLFVVGGQLESMGRERPELSAELREYAAELREIQTALNVYILQPLKTHGTQTGLKRAAASAANGKKGGRPPKHIAELKKRLAGLTDFCTDFEIRHSVEEWHTTPEYIEKDNARIQAENELERLLQEWQEKRTAKE